MKAKMIKPEDAVHGTNYLAFGGVCDGDIGGTFNNIVAHVKMDSGYLKVQNTDYSEVCLRNVWYLVDLDELLLKLEVEE